MSALRNPRTLLVALGISLLANMFMGGFIAARLSGPALLDGRTPARPRARVERRERPLRVLVERHRDEFRGSRRAVMKARREVANALVTEPFDRATLAAALDQLQAATSEAQAVFHRSLLDEVEKLPLAERQRLSEARRLWHGDGPRKHGPRP